MYRRILILCLNIVLINITQAEEFASLDEAIPDELIFTLAPIFDFDGNSCLPSAGISRSGQKNRGLKTGGNVTGECRASDFLDTSNTVHRYACTSANTSTYCGHFYALYFEKDQKSSSFFYKGGHRHDWEHVAIWTKDGVITHGSVSAHGKMNTKVFSELPFDHDGHMKVVYHKDGLGTHAMRFAGRDETAENPYGHFVTPILISWFSLSGDGISNSEMRTKLNKFDYGSAIVPLKRNNFISNLNKFKPTNYPAFQMEEDCKFTHFFSEESSAGQICPSGYVVTGIKCDGDFCDNKQLQCCRVPGLNVSGSLKYSPYFSEEIQNFYKDDEEVVVGMRCKGRYCDNVSPYNQKRSSSKRNLDCSLFRGRCWSGEL